MQGLFSRDVGNGRNDWVAVVLAALTAFFLATSWRKWPSPLVDFGHQLYVPWRITHGALLYRDVDNSYGPLSQYINAGLFRLFGSGMMVLVAANLAIFAAILILVYLLFRTAWGAAAAFAAAGVFIAVFGFSQYVTMGNYNYAAPYAHEVTHGVLVCLLLALVLSRWVEKPTVRWSLSAGLLVGLTAVLKPEFMLGAALETLLAVALRLRFAAPPRPRALVAGAAGAAFPTACFTVYFAAHEPWTRALSDACRAWLIPGGMARFTDQFFQKRLLGFDRPWQNLGEHAAAMLASALLVAVIAAAAWLADRGTRNWQRYLPAGALVAGLSCLSWFGIDWLNAGRCLLGLTLLYLTSEAVLAIRPTGAGVKLPVLALRLAAAALGAGLMARMLLNGRIYQYGFYQAALASVVLTAVLVGELPARLQVGGYGKAVAAAGAVALLLPGVARLAVHSQNMLRSETYAVGEGVDQFYSLPPEIEPAGAFVRALTDYLRRNATDKQTLLVLPEGEMINYLARMPSPVAPFFFYGASTSGGREEALVRELDRHPPDWVAIVSIDLRDHGIERYGEVPGNGQQIMRWLHEHYDGEASVGGDPLDVRQRGAILLRHRTGSS